MNRAVATEPRTRTRPGSSNAAVVGWWGVVLIPVVVHFWVLSRFGISIPKWDDHALRNFLVSFNQANSWIEKLRLLFAQHNEHRIVYDRLITLLFYQISGEINFVWLMAWGSLSLVGILVLFYQLIRRAGLPLSVFLPLPFLLLTLQHHENTLWGMAALQNFSVVFFGLLTFFYLAENIKRSFGWACFWAMAALCTSGNGVLVWAVGLVLLGLQKRWLYAAGWALLAVIALGLYFFDYQRPPGNPIVTVAGVGQYARGLLGFLGAVGDWNPNSVTRFVIPTLIGTGLLCLAILWGWKAFRKTPWLRGGAEPFDYFLLGVVGFVLATALVVTRGRIGFGEWVLLTSRVKIYSVVLLLTLLVAAFRNVSWLRGKTAQGLVLAGAVLFNLGVAFVEYGEVVFARHERVTWLYNWQHGRPVNEVPAYNRLTFPYRPPVLRPIPNGSVNESVALSLVREKNSTVLVENASYVGPVGPDEGAFVYLRGATGSYLFPTRQRRNRSRRSLLMGGGYFSPGFTAALHPNEAAAGGYDVEVVEITGERVKRVATNQTVTLRGAGASNLPKNW